MPLNVVTWVGREAMRRYKESGKVPILMLRRWKYLREHMDFAAALRCLRVEKRRGQALEEREVETELPRLRVNYQTSAVRAGLEYRNDSLPTDVLHVFGDNLIQDLVRERNRRIAAELEEVRRKFPKPAL